MIKTLVCKRQEKNYMVKVRKTLNLQCGLCLPLLALGIITQEHLRRLNADGATYRCIFKNEIYLVADSAFCELLICNRHLFISKLHTLGLN